jgi:hypothetical protein
MRIGMTPMRILNSVGVTTKPSDRFLEFLRSAEGDLLGRLDLDRFSGRGIAAHAGGALANLQNAKPADANAVSLLQVLGDLPSTASLCFFDN